MVPGELLAKRLLVETGQPQQRSAFWGCENYPECKFISKFEPTLKKCEQPECDGTLAKRTYRDAEVYECVKCKNRTPREGDE
jgi:DNA topoisomerase I